MMESKNLIKNWEMIEGIHKCRKDDKNWFY